VLPRGLMRRALCDAHVRHAATATSSRAELFVRLTRI
jgi:hypothetical protein